MAFDTETRNRLNKFVSDARALLTDEFTNQFQQDYGMDPDSGEVADLERLSHLDDARRQTAIILRDTLEHYYANLPTKQKKQLADHKQLIQRIIREQAFTILNRLCAIRMAEARDLVIESIASGLQSKGFQLYQPVIGNSLGDTGAAYQQYLLSLFDEFAADLPVLFDRFSPQGRLFPRESILTELLGLINDAEINRLWAEDETIGWIYQYFNSKEERRAMRDASTAPRNSRELAVRNQFFTPRYVVEFLTDNTLGRIWYEMRKGKTALKDTCQYLVRRPNEVFLAEDDKYKHEAQASELDNDLTQEQLLNQHVHIPHRPLKDPREIRMLDPACGSMHFGLYAFDLYLKIYEEFWDMCVADPDAVTKQLSSSDYQLPTTNYSEKAEFMKAVPRLIIEYNIHGIDIDPRAVQIAGLSLWLRAQRAWKSQGIAAADRPQVTRSNVVCAEPMPGDKEQLEVFCQELHPAIAQMVTAIFEEMKLAGEAGSLLKIEQEISSLVAKAKKQYQDNPPDKKTQMSLFGGADSVKEKQLEFDLSGITDEQFFEKAEETIYEALRKYASETSEGGFRRKLFAGDAEKGFAFIDLFQKSFDAVLMNPPFGDNSKRTLPYLKKEYPKSRFDLASAFIEGLRGRLSKGAFIGAITTRSLYFLIRFETFRIKNLFAKTPVELFVDLGDGVLDALISTALVVLRNDQSNQDYVWCVDAKSESDKTISIRPSSASEKRYDCRLTQFTNLPGVPLAYWCSPKLTALLAPKNSLDANGVSPCVGLQTNDDFRFMRLSWEVPEDRIGVGNTWVFTTKGGEYSKFWDDIHLVVNWQDDGQEIKEVIAAEFGSASKHVRNESKYLRKGLTYPFRTVKGFNARVLPKDCIFTLQGMGIFSDADDDTELLCALGLLNTHTHRYLLKMFTSGDAFQAGYVKKLPFLLEGSPDKDKIASACSEAIQTRLMVDRQDETSSLFVSPFSPNTVETNGQIRCGVIVDQLANISDRILSSISALNELSFETYDLSQEDRDAITASFLEPSPDVCINNAQAAERVVSYLVGIAFGRWSPVFTSEDWERLGAHAILGPLPNSRPGAFEAGRQLDVVEESESSGLSTLVRTSLTMICNENRDTNEQELVRELGCGLSAYLRNPNKFFASHLATYSKSRRSAPIYWPISTESGSYTLWFYYHRLTDQTLYKAVNDFVDPKLKQTLRQLADLRAIQDRSSDQEKEFAQLNELKSELEQFKSDLLEIAAFWKPNLNDGVQITAAPLWKFFRLAKWRNKLKKTWEELQDGKYDWAHVALSIWPKRVVKDKCTTDRSIAIAHDLEEQLWHEVDVTTTSRGGRETTKKVWQPRDLSEAELDTIVEAVKSGKHSGQTMEATS